MSYLALQEEVESLRCRLQQWIARKHILQPGEQVELTINAKITSRPIVVHSPEDIVSQPVQELNLSIRARKLLIRNDVFTVARLMNTSAAELREWRGCGDTTLDEIRDKLKCYGLKLMGD